MNQNIQSYSPEDWARLPEDARAKIELLEAARAQLRKFRKIYSAKSGRKLSLAETAALIILAQTKPS
jgi:hypothetical protein